jgi:broad specificity phosphatase PhoE
MDELYSLLLDLIIKIEVFNEHNTIFSLHKNLMPSIFAIRHGEADHNVGARIHGDIAYDMPEYWNPSLTIKGVLQAQNLFAEYPSLQSMRIIVSPLQRALETAHHAFAATTTFEIDDLVSEGNPAWRCNRRIDLVTLKDEWPGHLFRCDPVTPTREESDEDVHTRAVKFLNYARSLNEDVVLVSHYVFISELLKAAGCVCDTITHCRPIEIIL